MAIKVTEEGKRIGEAAQIEENRVAAKDLQRIEDAAKREAEAYVEAVDGDGNKQKAAEAAGTAFDFDEAIEQTKQIATEAAENADDPRFGPHGW